MFLRVEYSAVVLISMAFACAAQPETRSDVQAFSAPWIYGPNKVYRGRGSGYVQVHVAFTSSGSHVYFKSLTGLPAGVTAQYLCASTRKAFGTPAAPYCWVGATAKETDVFLRLTAAEDATLGTGTATLTLSSAGAVQPVSIPVEVVAAPPPPPVPSLHNVPLPGGAISTWKHWMDDPGYKWCEADGPINVPNEADIWYYDGGSAYFNISDFKQDPKKWKPCAYWVTNAWRDYLNRLGYLNAGWRVFVHGLYRAWQETHDDSYAKAIDVQANHSAYEVYLGPIARRWNPAAGGYWANGSREMLYRVQAYTFYEKTGGSRADEINEKRPKIFVAADRSIFTLDRFLHSPENVQTEWQTWIYGLGMRALIDYYEHTKGEPQGPDTRVLNTVREGVDWAYAHRDAHGAVLHNPFPKGPLCSYSCQQCVALENAFLAPAAAWLWRQTGDDHYRQVADDLFTGLTKWRVETRKQWTQSMYWTYDYFRWRTEGLAEEASRRRRPRPEVSPTSKR